MKAPLAVALATWGGVGRLPKAPGTWGSAAAVILGYAAVSAGLPAWSLGVAAAVLLPLGAWASARSAAVFGEEDPSVDVVDEVCGQWIALAAARSST